MIPTENSSEMSSTSLALFPPPILESNRPALPSPCPTPRVLVRLSTFPLRPPLYPLQLFPFSLRLSSLRPLSLSPLRLSSSPLLQAQSLSRQPEPSKARQLVRPALRSSRALPRMSEGGST